jgi:hypothetical protein
MKQLIKQSNNKDWTNNQSTNEPIKSDQTISQLTKKPSNLSYQQTIKGKGQAEM